MAGLIVVTGGSRGIGAAVALRLAEEGADIVLTYENSAERANGVVKQIEAGGRRALALQADSAVPEALVAAVDRAAATFGRLDILVNNAGVFLVGPLEDLGAAEVERTLRDRAPHVLGVTVAEHADGTGFTELTYLTSERESRAADRQMPVEMAVQLGTVRSYVEALEEVELRQPLLVSPAVPVA